MASKKRRRPQASKNGGNPIMAKAMLEFRQGSRTDLHMDRSKHNRNAERAALQRGRYDFS